MSGTTSRDLEEGNNVRTYSELEVLTKRIKYTSIAIAVWALGWAVFSCVLSQKVKGDSPKHKAVLLAAFALYLVEFVVQLLTLFAGWGQVPTWSIAIFLFVCRNLVLWSMVELQNDHCEKAFFRGDLPGWCGLVKGVPVYFAGFSAFVDIILVCIHNDYVKYWDGHSQNQYPLQSHRQQQTGSASPNGDGPAPPYDGHGLPTYDGGVPHAGDTKNDLRSSEIGAEDPFVDHGSEAGRSDSGHGNPRE